MEKILEGFPAKIFQHEFDHLQGIINIERKDARVKILSAKKKWLSF